jgi:Heme/copper-type cytochrome/quinol oxidase, subunit 3
MSESSHPYLQHHFADKEQQYQSAKLGMWAFLVTEVLTFAGLFCAYVILRNNFFETFKACSAELNTEMGLINTIVLITSSLTMALAIYYIQKNNRVRSMQMLGLTLVFAIVFMIIKYFEYTHKFHVGQLPSELYFFSGIPNIIGDEVTNPGAFFSVYFMMTGLHGIHVIGGMVVISWMMYNTYKGKYSSEYYTPVEITGLFWHLVDLIWIFLFPLLYLI